jgi:hypothetical protein
MSSAGTFSFNRNGALPVLALFVCLVLSACGGDRIEVERTSALPSPLLQGNFVVIPATQQDRARDYGKYADLIVKQMAPYGFSRVEDAAQARYALMFSYDGDGMERASEDRHRSLPEKRKSDNRIDRTVSIMIYDLTRPRLVDETVFGGFAQCAVDSAKRDPQVMPAMIDAIMKDFPGSGRETYSASVPSSK